MIVESAALWPLLNAAIRPVIFLTNSNVQIGQFAGGLVMRRRRPTDIRTVETELKIGFATVDSKMDVALIKARIRLGSHRVNVTIAYLAVFCLRSNNEQFFRVLFGD
jgi:hypothetical protein